MKNKNDKLVTPQSRLYGGIGLVSLSIILVISAYFKTGGIQFDDLFLPIIFFLIALPFLMTYKKYKIYYNNVRQREIAQPIASDESKLVDNSEFFMDEIIKEDSEFTRDNKKWSYITGAIIFGLIITNICIKPDEFFDTANAAFKYNLPFSAAFIYIAVAALLVIVIMIHKNEESKRNRQIVSTVLISVLWVLYVITVFVKSDQYLLIALAILLTVFVSSVIEYYVWRKKEPEPQYVDDQHNLQFGELEAINEEDYPKK